MPGAHNSLIGNAKQFKEYTEALKSCNEPLARGIHWVIRKHYSENGVFDSQKHKVILTNVIGNVILNICDPKMAQEVFQAKNKYVDKTGIF